MMVLGLAANPKDVLWSNQKSVQPRRRDGRQRTFEPSTWLTSTVNSFVLTNKTNLTSVLSGFRRVQVRQLKEPSPES